MKRVDAKLKESKKLVWGLIVNCIVYFKKQQVSLIMNQESTIENYKVGIGAISKRAEER